MTPSPAGALPLPAATAGASDSRAPCTCFRSSDAQPGMPAGGTGGLGGDPASRSERRFRAWDRRRSPDAAPRPGKRPRRTHQVEVERDVRHEGPEPTTGETTPLTPRKSQTASRAEVARQGRGRGDDSLRPGPPSADRADGGPTLTRQGRRPPALTLLRGLLGNQSARRAHGLCHPWKGKTFALAWAPPQGPRARGRPPRSRCPASETRAAAQGAAARVTPVAPGAAIPRPPGPPRPSPAALTPARCPPAAPGTRPLRGLRLPSAHLPEAFGRVRQPCPEPPVPLPHGAYNPNNGGHTNRPSPQRSRRRRRGLPARPNKPWRDWLRPYRPLMPIGLLCSTSLRANKKRLLCQKLANENGFRDSDNFFFFF